MSAEVEAPDASANNCEKSSSPLKGEPPAKKRLADEIKQEETAALYDASAKQQNAILDEIKDAQALVGEREPFQVIKAEYSGAASDPEFVVKANELSEKFSHIRRVRGDGNCFFRALAFAQAEYCLANPDHAKRFHTLVEGFLPRILAVGYDSFTSTDFHEQFLSLAAKLLPGDNQMTNEELMLAFNDEGMSNYYVVFMRLMASTYLHEHADEYAPFLAEDRDVEQYRREVLDPMYNECDHVSIAVLTAATDCPTRIEYMDRTQSASGTYHHDFCVKEDGQQPRVHLLYRPGHYDICYPIAPADK